MMRYLFIVPAIFLTACLGKDYSKEIIGKWECIETDIEFEGTPDPDEDTMYEDFKSGIEFRANNTCTDFRIPAYNPNHPTFYIGGIWHEKKYQLDGDEMLIDDQIQLEIISIDSTTLKLDFHLTLEQTQYNQGRLNKLRENGTGEKVIIHNTYRRHN